MIWFVIALAVPLSYGLTAGMRRYGISSQLLDHPNARSSHSVPTPRGGGLSIVIATTAGVLCLCLVGVVDLQLALAVIVGGAAIATVGFMDDRGSVRVSTRLAVHLAAAIWAVYILGGLPPILVGGRDMDLGAYGHILGVLGIIWALNLFNFMDGIDGIAASEAIFVAGAGAVFAWSSGPSHSVSFIASLMGAASFGFLLWNWPPARIFMGDVGSGYVGYALGVLALAAARDNDIALYQWVTLGGVFFADATVTLARRLMRGEKVLTAHRSHAYQWLARRWNSHKRVTLLVWMVNLCWLLPWAWAISVVPSHAGLITSVALAPIILFALAAGAGRSETSGSAINRVEP